MTQQTYYLEQAPTLREHADADYHVTNTLPSDNRKVIDKHDNAINEGTLPVRYDKEGNVVPYKFAVAYFGSARTIDESLVDIVCAFTGIFHFNVQEQMPGLISYNKDDKTVNVMVNKRDWTFANTQRMKFGKYLRKVGAWDETTINIMANKFKSTLHLIDNADLTLATGADIVDIYENGPNSCMSGDSFYSGDCNPANVYATEDIACAYVKVGDKIVARAMVNMLEKQYTTIYGNGALLSPLLMKHGYEPGSLIGCRILKIEDSNHGSYIMPYLDDASSVSEYDAKHFRIDDGGEVYCNCTNGLSEEGIICPECGDHVSPDDSYYVDAAEESFCSTHCIEEAGYIQAMTDGGWTEWMDAHDAYQTYNGEWYATSDELIEVGDDWYHQDDHEIVYSEDECEYLLREDCADVDDLGWISADRVTMP